MRDSNATRNENGCDVHMPKDGISRYMYCPGLNVQRRF